MILPTVSLSQRLSVVAPWLGEKIKDWSGYALLIRMFALSHLRERYMGTSVGLLWAFIHPIMLIAVFWVVFAHGFKMSATSDKPFLLLLITGIIPWLALSDAIQGAAGSIMARSYLVRKIAFPLEILPLTQIVATLIVLCTLLVLAVAIVAYKGIWPGYHTLWLPFFILAQSLFGAGIGFCLAALCVMFRDLQQATGIFLNIVFWATPIVWSIDMIPERFRWVIDVNPVAYLIGGFRHALLGGASPLPGLQPTLFFWGLTLFLLVAGLTIFRRLKPGFADLL